MDQCQKSLVVVFMDKHVCSCSGVFRRYVSSNRRNMEYESNESEL